MKEPKMNKMAKICMHNKAFRDSYQNLSQEPNKISVNFLNKKVVNAKEIFSKQLKDIQPLFSDLEIVLWLKSHLSANCLWVKLWDILSFLIIARSFCLFTAIWFLSAFWDAC